MRDVGWNYDCGADVSFAFAGRNREVPFEPGDGRVPQGLGGGGGDGGGATREPDGSDAGVAAGLHSAG